MSKKFKVYAVFILIALAIEGLGMLITKNNVGIYSQLNQPPLAPPGALFPVVWSILFILMGISSAQVYLKRDEFRDKVNSALVIYGIQLAVNFFWGIIFFNMRAYLFAFIWLLLLLVLIVMMILQFKKVNPRAAYLQIPYFLWVIFAGYLNLMIYILNG